MATEEDPEFASRFLNLLANATTVVSGLPCVLDGFTINTKGITNNITIYDNTAASGTKVGIFDTSTAPASYKLNVRLNTGLTVVIAGGTPADVTIFYHF